MDLKTFVSQMEQDARSELAKQFPGVRVETNTVQKLQNDSYTGLTITPAGQSVGMNLNLNKLYEDVERGRPYGEVLEATVDTAASQMSNMPTVDVENILNYQMTKEMLCVDVVSTERNAAMLKTVPHKNVEDLSMVYRLQIDEQADGVASILVTNQMLNKFGVSAEQLHVDALENAQQIRPASFRSMSSVMAEIMNVPEEVLSAGMEPVIYVATNQGKVHGAATIFYPNFMEQAAKEMGGDFYIIPSSIHEALLVPDDGRQEANVLKEMVRSINGSDVDPGEQLSDSVYHFDAKERIFEMGEKFEARRDAMEQSNRSSILKDLFQKKSRQDTIPKTDFSHKLTEPVR